MDVLLYNNHMTIDPSMNNNEAIRELLEENSRLLKDIHQATERTRRYILMGEILSVVKILIIVVPIIWGFIYLKPYLQNALTTYQEILGVPSAAGVLQPQDLLEELKKYQQNQ